MPVLTSTPVDFSSKTNMTTTQGLSPAMTGLIQQIMDREVDANLVFAQFGKEIRVPKNAGTRTVNLRRWVELDPSLDVLQEGIIPDPQMLSQEEITATVAPYGEYVRVTDELNMTALDKPMTDAVQLVSRQAAKSMDLVVRTELQKCTNVLYANGKDDRTSLAADTDYIKAKDIQKAVRLLERTNTRKIGDGYVGVLCPDTKYALMNDPLWIDVAKYQDAQKLYNGEVGKLYGVRFVETTNAPIIDAEPLSEGSDTLKVYSWTAGTKTIVVDNILTADDATALAGKLVNIGGEVSEIASATAGAAQTASIVLKAAPSSHTPAQNDVIYDGNAGASGASIAQTFIFGGDAYDTTMLEGGGQPRIIVKPLGSAGAQDPLEQYGTVGYKIEGYGAKILHDTHMVVIESALLDA